MNLYLLKICLLVMGQSSKKIKSVAGVFESV